MATRFRCLALVALGLVSTVALLAAVWAPIAPVDAQDRTEERLAALETQVADHERAISSLRKRVRKLERAVQTPGADEAGPAASDGVATPTPKPTATPRAAASGPVGSFTNPVPFGHEAEIPGKIAIRVIDVIPDATDIVLAENPFNDPPAPGRQFYIVTVSVTNNGSAPLAIGFMASFSAVGKSAVAYATYEDSCGVIPNELPTVEVFPGGTVEGNICWAVRTEDVDSLVMFVDSFVSFRQEDRVYFSLQREP